LTQCVAWFPAAVSDEESLKILYQCSMCVFCDRIVGFDCFTI
jgi:hypothetical protein